MLFLEKFPIHGKMYDGFFGKTIGYIPFIPNIGWQVPLNGVLDFYAQSSQRKPFNFKIKKNLVGLWLCSRGNRKQRNDL